MYSYWLLSVKLKYSEHSVSYTMPQYMDYWDLGKGKVIADSIITTTLIAFIFTRYCLFSMFYWFMWSIQNLFGKMCIESASMNKSHIALIYLFNNGQVYSQNLFTNLFWISVCIF